MTKEMLKKVVEALIFAADTPLSAAAIKRYVDEVNGSEIDAVIAGLNAEYEQEGRAFQIVRVAGGFQMSTRPEYANWIRKMYTGRIANRLSQAALEALAIIAFKQPLSKAEIAGIRGVNSDWVLKSLLEKKLITIAGRGEGVGKPLLYATTDAFLQYFGINDINELPRPREIEELFGDSKYSNQIIEALSRLDEPESDGEPPAGEPLQSGSDADNATE